MTREGKGTEKVKDLKKEIKDYNNMPLPQSQAWNKKRVLCYVTPAL